MPRKPAERPWLALGVSPYYRRRAKARQQAAQAAVFDRLQWQLAELRSELDKAAAHAIMDSELAL
jgi:hypothetical protein